MIRRPQALCRLIFNALFHGTTFASLITMPWTSFAQTAKGELKEWAQPSPDKTLRFAAPVSFLQTIDDEVKNCKTRACFMQMMQKHAMEAAKAHQLSLQQIYPGMDDQSSLRFKMQTLVSNCLKGQEFLEYVACEVSASFEINQLIESIEKDRAKRALNHQMAQVQYPFLKALFATTCGDDQAAECFDKNLQILKQQMQSAQDLFFSAYKESLMVSRQGLLCQKKIKGKNQCQRFSKDKSWAGLILDLNALGEITPVEYRPLSALYFAPGRQSKPALNKPSAQVPFVFNLPLFNQGDRPFLCPSFLHRDIKYQLGGEHFGDLGRILFHDNKGKVALETACYKKIQAYAYPKRTQSKVDQRAQKAFKNFQKVYLKSKGKGLAQMQEGPCHFWFQEVLKGPSLQERLKSADLTQLAPNDELHFILKASVDELNKQLNYDLGHFAISTQAHLIALSSMQATPSLVRDDKGWQKTQNKILSKVSCLPSSYKKSMLQALKEEREELKAKLPQDDQEVLRRWVGGLKELALQVKKNHQLLEELEPMASELYCHNVPPQTEVSINYTYSGGKKEAVSYDKRQARYKALEALAQLQNRETNIYVDKEGQSSCGQIRRAIKSARSQFPSAMNAEPLLAKSGQLTIDRFSYQGPLYKLLVEEAYDHYGQFKTQFTVKIAKQVAQEGLSRLSHVCQKKSSGVINEGERLATSDGMLSLYLGCQDIEGNPTTCSERKSAAWLMCRNYYEQFSKDQDDDFYGTLKTVGIAAGLVLAGLASVPSLGGSVALAAALGLPIGAFITAVEVTHWQKARQLAPALRDDFLINRWGDIGQFKQALESMDDDVVNFAVTQMLVNGIPMALDAVALVRVLGALEKAQAITSRVEKIKTLVEGPEFNRAFEASIMATKSGPIVGDLNSLKNPIAEFMQKSASAGKKHAAKLRKILGAPHYYGDAIKALSDEDIILMAIVEERLSALEKSANLGQLDKIVARHQIEEAIKSCGH